MKTIYIVILSEGGYSDYSEWVHFATFNKRTAEKYVEKFNRVLNAVTNHYYKNNIDSYTSIEIGKYKSCEWQKESNRAKFTQIKIK